MEKHQIVGLKNLFHDCICAKFVERITLRSIPRGITLHPRIIWHRVGAACEQGITIKWK